MCSQLAINDQPSLWIGSRLLQETLSYSPMEVLSRLLPKAVKEASTYSLNQCRFLGAGKTLRRVDIEQYYHIWHQS
jgi:hypothetical protein